MTPHVHDGQLVTARAVRGAPWLRWNRGRMLWALYWIAVGIFAVVALAPLVAILRGSFSLPIPGSDAVRFGTDAWAHAFEHRNVTSAIKNTVLLALAGQVIALPLGVLIAFLIGRTNLPGRKWFELGFWISFFLPVLAVLQGWILLLDPHYGLLNLGLKGLFGAGAPILDIYSWWGIVFAHLITNTISAKVMMMTPAFQNMDLRLEEAARLSGDHPVRTFFRITLPLALPIILATATIGLIRTLESFEIEFVLGTPRNITVYSTLIYDMIGNDPADFATASVLGVIIVLFLTLLAALPLLLTRVDRRASEGSFVTLSSHVRQQPLDLGRWKLPAAILVGTVVLLLTVVPIVFLIASSLMTMFGFFNLPEVWTFAHWREVFSDATFVRSLGNTLQVALTAAAISIVAATAIAYGIVRSPFRGRQLLGFLAWIPSTMPGVLFSLALLWLILGNSWLIPFYGTNISLAVAIALGTLTFGVQIIKTNLAQIARDQEEAAWVAGYSKTRAVLRIVVPLAMRSIIVVGLVTFISAARNIGQIALLVSSQNRPLAMLQLEYMSDGRYEPSAVVGVIVVAMAIAAALVVRRLGLRLAGVETAPVQSRNS